MPPASNNTGRSLKHPVYKDIREGLGKLTEVKRCLERAVASGAMPELNTVEIEYAIETAKKWMVDARYCIDVDTAKDG